MADTLDKIIRTYGARIEDCVDFKLLNRMTTWFDPNHIHELDWERVRKLHILGTKRDWESGPPLIDGKQLKRGCYVGETGAWVMLTGPESGEIQRYLNCCPPELKRLFIGHTDIAALALPPLERLLDLHLISNSNLADLSGLDRLPMLEVLELKCFSPSFLLDLTPCSQLHTLALSGSGVTDIRLDQPLDTLRQCAIADAPIQDLNFLCNCPGAEFIGLARLPIRHIPDGIRNMKKLNKLWLWDLSLMDIPDWLPELKLPIGREFTSNICLHNTTIEGVDMSVFDQSQEMIRAWFKARKKEKEGGPLNEIKVVFLGDGSTGKSLTVARLLEDGALPEKFDGEATPGIAIEDRPYTLPDGRNIQVHFWDFGGQEILHCMHRIFLTDRTLYVVMINARNNTQDDQARYWLHNVSSFAPDCPVLLVLNQIDQNPNASINERGLKKQYPALQQVIRLSALNFDRETFNREFTDKLLSQIARFESLGAFFPQNWKQIMDKVRGMEGNYIRGNEFHRICKESGVEERSLCRDLLKWFNDIGVSFCCNANRRLQNYVVLKPEWITNAIYTILWNKRSEAVNGMVDQDEIYRLLSPEEGDDVTQVRSDMTYEPEDVDYVLSITRQFRLSFPIDARHEFIPMLCGADALPEADEFLEESDVIEFRMEYDYLPANVLHRLMVDMRGDLCRDKVWLTGALFHQKFNHVRALVKSEGNILSIYIHASDPGHRAHTYLNTLRSTLEAIHKDMGLKPPKMLAAYTEDGQTEYFSYKQLEGARLNGQVTQYSELFDKMIPIDAILNGTDSRVAAEKEQLLKDLAEICLRMRGKRNLNNASEDERNDDLRDALRYMRYRVSDQTRVGRGGTGRRAGSLDLQLLHEGDMPWTNIEAMNLNGATKKQLRYWENHLDRLMDNYNPAGLPTLFLVSYVNCSADTYHALFSAYAEHMRTYEPPQTQLRHGTLTEVLPLKDQHGFVRATRCTYDRGGTPVTVYHYFVGFTEDQQ